MHWNWTNAFFSSFFSLFRPTADGRLFSMSLFVPTPSHPLRRVPVISDGIEPALCALKSFENSWVFESVPFFIFKVLQGSITRRQAMLNTTFHCWRGKSRCWRFSNAQTVLQPQSLYSRRRYSIVVIKPERRSRLAGSLVPKSPLALSLDSGFFLKLKVKSSRVMCIWSGIRSGVVGIEFKETLAVKSGLSEAPPHSPKDTPSSRLFFTPKHFATKFLQ